MDLRSRLRTIVNGGAPRELTYEPDTGRYEATIDLDRVADVLGGRVVSNPHGRALIIDRRYESDRFHGTRRVGACEVPDGDLLRVLDPRLPPPDGVGERTLFVDLETTGLSGGAGTVAFLVGIGWFDMGAFQVRQFLLTSYASERALLCAVADCFDAASLLVTYNGKTFDVPVMETRWLFHRMPMPLESVRHFDMLHPARRLWRRRGEVADSEGCRLGTLERVLCDVTRVGDVPGMDIPARYFRFLRSGDALPLEPVLEHNRLDLISLAAVAAHAVDLVAHGGERCRDAAEAVALGRVYERAGSIDRALACFNHAAGDPSAPVEVTGEALYRLGVRLRRDRRFAEAADAWRRILELKTRRHSGQELLATLRQYATEALAVHHEHRERDLEGARELALRLLDDETFDEGGRARHRLARIDRKLAARRPTTDTLQFGA
jgi:tetratricopeptide (TPR) repeat protein